MIPGILAGVTIVVAVGLLAMTVRHGRPLFGRGETADVPDDLDDVLRARIDGDEAYAADQLPCGCPLTMPVTARCRRCGWRSCLAHAGATHWCEPEPGRQWQDSPLPPREAKQVNGVFADLVNSDLADLRRVDQDLAQYYVIGDER